MQLHGTSTSHFTTHRSLLLRGIERISRAGIAAVFLILSVVFAVKETSASPFHSGRVSGANTDNQQDSPMWGGTPSRNLVSNAKNISTDFSVVPQKKILWTAKLGSTTYGGAVVADGKVFVGTNNAGEYRPKHKHAGKDNGDRGVLLCFEEKTGKFLWQLTRKKLEQGRSNDWPEQGICSIPCVEGKRLYVVTNRCELMCLDTEGFRDGKNDGAVTDEVDTEKEDADIVWSIDMIGKLGVFPHNLATSSPVIHGNLVFALTSNGVDDSKSNVPAPNAPSFLAADKTTGKIVWTDASPGDKILDGQWSSPTIGVVNGKAQVYMPGGDGWIYAFDAVEHDGEKPRLIWKFNLNPKDAVREPGNKNSVNAIVGTPVFLENSVVAAVGQDPENGEGVGHIYRIDATKTGDISESGKLWHFGGMNEKEEFYFRRTMSTAAVANGMVFIPDLSGFLHCLDFKTGKRHWEKDLKTGIWSSALAADGKLFLGDDDGNLHIYEATTEGKELATKEMQSKVASTPTIANGVMYITNQSMLFAIDIR